MVMVTSTLEPGWWALFRNNYGWSLIVRDSRNDHFQNQNWKQPFSCWLAVLSFRDDCLTVRISVGVSLLPRHCIVMSTEQRSLGGLVEKLRQEQEFVQFYKGQIRQGVQELNKRCDNVFQSLWVCHTLTFGLSRVLSRHVTGSEWSLVLDQGVEFINAANVLQSHTHVDQYSRFLNSLLKETKLLSEILQLAESESLDCQWLISDLMATLFAHCLFQRDHTHFLRLLEELLRQHVRFCSSPKDLFGGEESMFNKVLLEYCSQLLDLKSFQSELLAEVVMDVVALDDYLEYDVSKAGSRFHTQTEQNGGLVGSSVFLFGEDLESSCDQLASLAMRVVDKLAMMSTHLPSSIKWLLGMLKRAAKRKWPLSLNEERRLISDALFGAILCSAIVNPDTHSIIDQGVVVGPVARYNLTQVTVVLQRSAWNVDKQPIQKVVKRMDMEVYNSVLDSLDGGSGEREPELPSYLPGLRRSSFLASQAQLNNLVGLAASLLTNRDGRGAFHSQLSELLSTLSHTLIDMASTQPYTITPVTTSLPSSMKKTRGDKRAKKRGSMGGTAHMSTQSPTVPRSRSVGTIATLDVNKVDQREISPPADSASGCGFMLPAEVLILPFIDDPSTPTKGQWDFHLLTEEEFMAPMSPTLPTISEEPKHSSIDTSATTSITTATTPNDSPVKLKPPPRTTPIEHSDHVPSGGVPVEGGRLRANTMPTPTNPSDAESERGASLSSWSPVKGACFPRGGLDSMEEEDPVNPYDRLEAREVYIPSSSSSVTTSPLSPSPPGLSKMDMPTIVTSSEEASGEASDDKKVGVVSEQLSDGRGDSPEGAGSEGGLSKETETEPTKKSKKRKKFWPFRKHKSVEVDKKERKSRSERERGSKVKSEAAVTKSRSQSDHGVLEDGGSQVRKRRSYTLLTGHITAKYAANARKQVAQAKAGSSNPLTLPSIRPKRVERFDSLPPAEMSPDEFHKSLYCDQLKYKLRSSLMNTHTPLTLSEEADTRYQLVLLTQQSLQRARWRHEVMEVSLLSELLRMIEPLSNELVETAVEGLYLDYNKRSAYIGYLVKSHQRFQDAQLQVASLQCSVDRLMAVSREVFVGFAVEAFLEQRGAELKEFAQEMGSLLAADDKCSLAEAKQRTLKEAINNDSTWLCWSDMEEVMCRLDNHLFAYVYEHVFHPNGDSDTMRDQIYSQHLTRLADTISVSHKSLQISSVYHSSCPWDSAQSHLKVMSSYKSPRGKVQCVVQCCKVLISLLQLAKCGDPPGADDMFPVIVYVLIRTNPPGLLSTVQYIKYFIESELSGEDAYWWAQFSTAVEFTKTLE